LDVKQLAKKVGDVLEESLSFGKKTIFGLDIGLSSVKVAEVDANPDQGKFVLKKFASVTLPEGAVIEDEIQKEEEIVEAIKQAVEKAGITSKYVCLCLSGPNTVSRKLSLAGGSMEEIEDQVLWEAEQYLPFDIEQSTLDFHIIGENEGGGVDVILAAVKNDVVFNFSQLVAEAGFKVKIIDLGIIATTNVFEIVMEERLEDPLQSFLILDIGAQKTSFIIYKAGMIMFSKEIAVGGLMITEEIQRQMGVNYFEAEDLKITGDDQGNLPEEILEIIDDVVETFFSELKKTLDFYVSSTQDESLVACCVTGGSAQIPGILEGLEALLGVDVLVLNPFEVFTYNEKDFGDRKVNDIAYRGVVTLGGAIRQLK
jgi:type IV pilus assembly protein PilM